MVSLLVICLLPEVQVPVDTVMSSRAMSPRKLVPRNAWNTIYEFEIYIYM